MNRRSVVLAAAVLSTVFGVIGEGLDVYGEILQAVVDTQKTAQNMEDVEVERLEKKKIKLQGHIDNAISVLSGCRDHINDSDWQRVTHQLSVAQNQLKLNEDGYEEASDSYYDGANFIIYNCPSEIVNQLDIPTSDSQYVDGSLESGPIPFVIMMTISAGLWGYWIKLRKTENKN